MRDLLLTADFDLDFATGGDLKTGDAVAQHKRCLIVANRGDYRQFPWVGVGIEAYLLDENFGDVQAQIQKQFELDGMVVRDLRITAEGGITENSQYR